MKLGDLVKLLNETEGVLEAYEDKDPVALGRSGRLEGGAIIVYFQDGPVVRKDIAEYVVVDRGKESESAGWMGKVPLVLAEPEAPDHGPLGDDAALLALLPVRIVKPEISRGENEARVSGYEVIDEKAIPCAFMLYTDGQEVKVVREDLAASTKAVGGLEPAK